jgi:DNA polymerase
MIHLDLETTSLCDIDLGAYRQGNDPSTKILMFAVADGDGEPLIWDSLDRECPESATAHALLARAIRDGELIFAHSAQYEVALTHYRLAKDVGLEPPPLSVWRCTQAMCRRAAIPPSLANAAAFLGVTDKDKVGKLLINIFSKQNQLVTLSKMRDRMKVPSPLMVDPIPWDWTLTLAGKTVTVREAWELFKGYCKQDVRVEQQIHAKLHHFELEGEHLANFQFNMRMNHRGIPVNLEKLHAAKSLVDELQGSAAERLKEMTGCTPTQTARFTLWLEDRGYPKGKGIAADVVEKLMADPATLTEEVRVALLLRGESAFAAVAKIPTMIAAACDDGLVRGTVQDFGARTGRATGQIIQVQNFRKSTIQGAHTAYDWLGDGLDVATLRELWGEPLETLASCVRHFIQDPTHDFLDVDFAGIEARITPWLSGDTDELNVILSGKDQYKVCASEVIFNVPYDAVTKEQRTTAKPVVLSCCFGTGGEGLMIALWDNYGIRRTLKECDGYVAAWRKKHKATKDAWKAISDAAIAAIKESADTLILDGKIKIGCRTLEGVRYLIIKLPNGRKIFYPEPEVKRAWKEHSAAAKKADPRKAEEKGYTTDEISFYGKQKKGGWGRVSTWGSRLFENCVQAIGADFLNHGCLKAEAAGYDIFMVVHDQALALNTGPLDGFIQAFCTKPEWALDFPLDAAGAITPYYLKED